MSSTNNYKGTTVNERLYLSGLLQEFDTAVSDKNVEAMVVILKAVALDEASINAVAAHFGFKRSE